MVSGVDVAAFVVVVVAVRSLVVVMGVLVLVSKVVVVAGILVGGLEAAKTLWVVVDLALNIFCFFFGLRTRASSQVEVALGFPSYDRSGGNASPSVEASSAMLLPEEGGPLLPLLLGV